jgi:uncharacterized protein (UPF0276 family)
MISPPRLGLPDLGLGVGLRTPHYHALRHERPALGFLEIISDNYLDTAGRPLEVLDELAAHYPLVMHGVALSIGSTAPLNRAYVRQLVRLRDRVGARWVSDHLCFTGIAGNNTHDLLPLPLTAAALDHVAQRVHAVQDLLGAPLVIENPSTYVAWRDSTMPEWDFLAELCARTGCGLLLDVNNIYVSARNHGFEPADYLAAVPWDRVVQFHIAGHRDHGDHVVDTHDAPVIDAVWDLLRQAWPRCGGASVLLEWDADIPPFAELYAELMKAQHVLPRAVAMTP